jgi:succinate dehydrogenase / fumarate reductase cytochrome b subunit
MSLSTSAESSESARATDRGAFVLRRLHSLFGVVPLGAFVVLHLLAMARAMWGRGAFAAVLAHVSPGRLMAEAAILGVPLLVHAGLGVSIAVRSRPNVMRYPSNANWRHVLVRASGIVTLLFLVVHVWQTRIRLALGRTDSASFHTDFAALLSSTGFGGVPWWAIGYLLGVAAAAYHFSNGVAGFASSFGLVRSLASLKRLEIVCALVGLLLFLVGALTVIYFATGWPTFGMGTSG